MTTLKVAETEDDYDACRSLMRTMDAGDSEIDFPTIMMFDDDEEEHLLGFIATTPKPDMILAGPLVMASEKPRPFALLKLMEGYDKAMVNMGIHSYIFWTKNGSDLAKAIARLLNIEPYASDGERLFYVRKLVDGRR